MPFTRTLLLSILLLLCGTKLFAQQKSTTVDLFYEKAYLHTDRDVYTQGDNIWFKAYLLNASNNTPIGFSNNLYVELIGPGLTIIKRLNIRLDDGLGNGDLKLADTLTAGTYRLRAYTNWMRNFGDKFIFEKNVIIVKTSATASVAATTKPLKPVKQKATVAGTEDLLPAGPIVRFFPEGGYLINDVRSTVAFKAEDEHGRGIAVSGNIIASSGREVAKFTCDSTGMGTFTMRPDESQQYHAELTINGKPYRFNVGKPLHKGFVLSVNTAPGNIIADISCNGFMLNETGGTDLVAVAKHGDKICYKQRIGINSKNALLQIPDANFPEGIASITLYNEYAQPIGERLIYVHHDNYAKLSLTIDKAVYASKEKVTVKIKLTDTAKAHLSLSVVDATLVPVKPGDMLSYLNLRSEINGPIEHPERYFDTTNANRFKQMDALLLTQGWRSYVWQRIADSIPRIKYDVEQGITLTGRVRKVFGKAALAGMNITMFAPKAEGAKLFTAVTDTAGNFRIDGAKFFGYQFINFTSRRADLIRNGESKGKKGGWIQVDSLDLDALPVHPAIAETDTTPVKTDALTANDVVKKKFSFEGNNQLNAVQVKGYTNALPTEEHTIGPAEHKDYGSLMHYLLYMIPGAHEEEGKCREIERQVLMFSHFPAKTVSVSGVYSDNSKINYKIICDDDYLEQPMINVYKVTIFRRMTVYGLSIGVFVVLKPGVLTHMDFDNALADVTGYYKARNFYAPHYYTPTNTPDYRTTIHWEPNITTDANGEATITYYNADPENKIRLVVQGVTDKGVVVAAGAGYEVK